MNNDDLAGNQHLLWNRFVEFLVHADVDELDEVQRSAYLTFWYESEVQNGGHLQFFLNRPSDSKEATVLALQALGADRHASLLVRAIEIWRPTEHREAPRTPHEFSQRALEGEFEALDREFYELTPTLSDALEDHLIKHRASYFIVEG